jgi:hypothetical protein
MFASFRSASPCLTKQLLKVIVVLRGYGSPCVAIRAALLPKPMITPDPLSANRTCDWLRPNGWEIMDHPTYSPNHVPSDFHFLWPLKKHLAGKRFVTGPELKKVVTSYLQTLDIDPFDTRIQALVPRRDKCLNVNCECVEVWCVPCAAYVPYVRSSQYNILCCLWAVRT